MSAQARDARIHRLQTMASDHAHHHTRDLPPLLVPGALFEATLRTLQLPPAILQPQDGGGDELAAAGQGQEPGQQVGTDGDQEQRTGGGQRLDDRIPEGLTRQRTLQRRDDEVRDW